MKSPKRSPKTGSICILPPKAIVRYRENKSVPSVVFFRLRVVTVHCYVCVCVCVLASVAYCCVLGLLVGSLFYSTFYTLILLLHVCVCVKWLALVIGKACSDVNFIHFLTMQGGEDRISFLPLDVTFCLRVCVTCPLFSRFVRNYRCIYIDHYQVDVGFLLMVLALTHPHTHTHTHQLDLPGISWRVLFLELLFVQIIIHTCFDSVYVCEKLIHIHTIVSFSSP